ncbi:hypothetical protein CNMCM7691_009449 [Aspergillus felis]|uniref:Peptidase S54 rhomboid domain-containing protein n=1 Tax=Aspergillus felis TaxID=1287682 RepID=A0A8H6V799_9EURO|nr:hypothetical protein CNMCM7691_009449 [Aspergillus felis]
MATPAALPPLPFNPTRVRSYVLRLPLFTRLVLLVIVAFWLLELQTIWSVVQWGSLTPSEIGFGTMYRLNTYPFIHVGFFHAFVNLVALTPLLERFEAEHGTLTALALFLGPLSTFPAGIYILIEKFILHSNTAVVGASVWVFLLLGSEAIRTFKSNPYFSLGTTKIPTWTSPLFACALVSIFVPNTSFLGHLSAIIIGYLLGLGYLKVLVPPEKILRWIEGKLNLLGRLPHYVRDPQIAEQSSVSLRVVWLLLLPLDEYARRTYISENALLPGQVHAYFSGSEQNIFRGYKRELESLLNSGNQEGQEAKDSELTPVISDQIQSILRAAGLKVATQKYEYTSSGITHEGQNVYAIIHAPRGDATEAIVLVAAWKTADGELNLNGVSLALTLARYFKRGSKLVAMQCGKGVIQAVLMTIVSSKSGTQAWIDAYHDMQPSSVQPLPLKSGALQGGLVIEYPFDHRFESLHIVYDGVNGQLPNLDLFNTAISVAGGQMGIGTNLQEMWEHDDSYQKRLQTILRGMIKQGFGHATGAHSSFMPYHIDAITLQTKGDGWQDEMALGRTVESLCRSLNNLLEHLHQSFFFYLLMHTNRFVSIGTYLPSAMLIAGNFTIMAMALWMRTGYYMHALATSTTKGEGPQDKKSPADQVTNTETNGELNDPNPKELPRPGSVLERQLALPLTLVIGLHLLGLVPLFIFNNIHHKYYTTATYTCLGAGVILPLIVSALLNHGFSSPPTTQQYFLTKSFSLLLLGLFLSTLATLNFSLSFMVGLLCAPLSFVKRINPRTKAALRYPIAILGSLALNALSPPAVLIGACWYSGVSVEMVLTQAAFGWNVSGMWTQLVVWCVWWPAWMVGCVLLGSSLL